MKSRARHVASVLVLVQVTWLAVPHEAEASDWSDDLAKIAQRIEQGRWQPARKAAIRLASEVTTGAWSRRGLDRLLGEVCLYRAVAEINLGLDREAIWHWQMALHLWPGVADSDLAAWGRAVALTEYPLRPVGSMPPGLSAPGDIEMLRMEPAELTTQGSSATLRNRAIPRDERIADIHIEVAVDRDGMLRRARVLTDYAHPIVIYGVLEWMLELPPARPARIDGEPVDSLTNLAIGFGSGWSAGGLSFNCLARH